MLTDEKIISLWYGNQFVVKEKKFYSKVTKWTICWHSFSFGELSVWVLIRDRIAYVWIFFFFSDELQVQWQSILIDFVLNTQYMWSQFSDWCLYLRLLYNEIQIQTQEYNEKKNKEEPVNKNMIVRCVKRIKWILMS